MPRNGKRKYRLTRKEIRNVRKLIGSQVVGENYICEAKDISNYESPAENIPSTLHVVKVKNGYFSRVFEILYPDIKFIILSETDVAFYDETGKADFEQWYAEYIKMYGPNLDFQFPPPTDGIYPYLESSIDNSPKSHSRSRYKSEMENWAWCLQNCEQAVRYCGNFFFFASSEDAALYRITRL